MTKLENLKEILYNKNASLVVLYKNGEIKEYYQDRILDLKDILSENSKALQEASIADKVIGKTAAAILAVAAVKEVYADVISELAIPILEEKGIKFEYSKKVEFIKNNDNTAMCPMENRFKDEKDINNIYSEIFKK